MKMTELEDQIQKVRDLRANRLALQTEVDQIELDMMSKHAKLYQELGATDIDLGSAEEKLRQLILIAYQETGNKKPAPGVGIRIVKEMLFDEDEAVQWAIRANAMGCLSLQKANFKKVAEGLELDFVEILEVPKATIAKEL